MKLSILIPSYNMKSKIDQCLLTIFTDSADRSLFEVIVCDSSDDDSMEVFKKWMMKEDLLKVMHSHKKMHIGPARNLAYSKSKGDYILCLDIDDKLASLDAMKKLLDLLDGKDIYACSYVSRLHKKEVLLKPTTIGLLAQCPVACWTKVYKRELYVPFPGYMPEDVFAHYMLIDKCKTVGFTDFVLVDYDNTPENKGAISRTFDWCKEHPTNLLQLAVSDLLKKIGLNEEYVAGVIHNLADMWKNRGLITQPEVKKAYASKLTREYQNFMSGIYVH